MSRVLHLQRVFNHEAQSIGFVPGANLVTGSNSAGKSSALTALGAVVSFEPDPRKVGQLSNSYLLGGGGEGMASMDGVVWSLGKQAGIQAPQGASPEASKASAGLVDFTARMTPKDRAATWHKTFAPMDPHSMLREAYANYPSLGGEERLQVLCQRIVDEGWDQTHEGVTAQLRAAKSRWTEISGEAYGSKKIKDWRPHGWNDACAQPIEVLERDVKTTGAARQKALTTEGVSKEMLAQAQKAKQDLIEISPRVQAATEAQETAEAALKEARAQGAAVQDRIAEANRGIEEARRLVNSHPPHKCPRCGIGLHASPTGITEWTAPTAEAISKASADAARIQAELEGLKADLALKRNAWGGITHTAQTATQQAQELRTQQAALERLAGNADRPLVEEANASLVSASQMAYETALANLDLRRISDAAKQAAAECLRLEKIAALVGPSGVRMAHLQALVGDLRASLERIMARTQWRQKIDIQVLFGPNGSKPEIALTVDGRALETASQSERLKAQIAIQTAVFVKEHQEGLSRWLILDATDILKGDSWRGFVALVNQLTAKLPEAYIVVAAAETEPPEGWSFHDLGEA